MQNYPKRTYKSRLFEMIFSQKEELLELYNAMNGTTYEDPELLDINTLENAIYMSMRNDLSFRDDILADFLRKNRAEAKSVSIYEYDEEKHMRQVKEEGRQEGIAVGISRGIEQGIEQGITKGITQGEQNKLLEQISKKLEKGKSIPQIADELEENEETILRLIEALEKKE